MELVYDDKTGTWGEAPEAYGTIECATKEDYEYAKKAIKGYKELEAKHWDECRQIAHYDDELKEAKRLLKAAIEDVETLAKAFAEDEPCGSFTLCSECPLCIKEGCFCKEWRYKAEALKLIGGETDEKP